jgi:hypothetical protein
MFLILKTAQKQISWYPTWPILRRKKYFPLFVTPNLIRLRLRLSKANSWIFQLKIKKMLFIPDPQQTRYYRSFWYLKTSYKLTVFNVFIRFRIHWKKTVGQTLYFKLSFLKI